MPATTTPHGDPTFELAVTRAGVTDAALPVALDLRGGGAEGVRRLVEGELGWQPVDDATAALIPPVVRLADVAAPAAGDGIPTVLLVPAEASPVAAAQAVGRLRPSAVLAWPADHDDLRDAVARATLAPRRRATEPPVVRVGGAAGGVGTTTVALALAGLTAWVGPSTLLVSGDVTQLPAGTPTIEPAALSAADLWARATVLTGVPACRAVRTVAAPEVVEVVDPAIGAVVADVGVADEVEVLVCRPDAPGMAALERAVAATIVVMGEGPVPARPLAAAIGSRRRIDLPRSARVSRAAIVGRVPAALPGRFVRALAPLVPDRGGP